YGIDDSTLWDRSTNLLAWKLYLGELPSGAELTSFAAPGREENLTGLPDAFIMVGDLDLFVDENIAYAQRLLQAGVATELHVYPGAIHGFDILAPQSEVARKGNLAVKNALRKALFEKNRPETAG
ncbi:alpha/beta hydrolase fold domain-containing protein, partial [Luminiphilus syltensis]|uniref:alpha/beta hydrolase fold domain-containing protein n=1 Tax=Luminiphilus syltensis TaxID=1341119 RepID=UPI000590195A